MIPHIATVTPLTPKRRGRPTVHAATLARHVAHDEAPTVPEAPNLVDYVYIALRNLPAAVIGALIGAWIPLAISGTLHTVDFTHLATKDAVCLLNWARIVLALCGLAYSVPSVREVIRQTGKTKGQALFFTLITEGVMAIPLSQIPGGGMSVGAALQIAALCVLCACNMLSMATVLTRGSRELALKRLRKLASKGVAAP